ncbi:hypothetical protein TRIUR3_31749 [Triticum urartu]|uniref:BI1-like protein n=1 Tax=Triticum urartu TaxID=4572 RepID=M8A7Z9_TRIUA|nr:hypothetical protein TRIUR3_31749 [Triticum urartu]
MKGGDVEAGTAEPKGTTESPELRWALIRKIYVVLCLQLLLTAAVAVVFVRVRAIPHFFVSSYAVLGLYIFILIFPFIVMFPLHFYRQKHPVNLLLLGVFTVAISFSVGLTCAFTSDFFPLGKLSHMIYGALAALIFSGYIVYDTGSIIKRYKYDEYVWAAVTLYLDIINLFLGLLTLFRACDN